MNTYMATIKWNRILAVACPTKMSTNFLEVQSPDISLTGLILHSQKSLQVFDYATPDTTANNSHKYIKETVSYENKAVHKVFRETGFLNFLLASSNLPRSLFLKQMIQQ